MRVSRAWGLYYADPMIDSLVQFAGKEYSMGD